MDLFTFALVKKNSSGGGGSAPDLSAYAKKTDLNTYAKKDEVKAYVPFPDGWITVAQDSSKTIKDLCDVIKNDELEKRKIIGPLEGSKPRKILITMTEWLEMKGRKQ